MSDPVYGPDARRRLRILGAVLWPSFLTAGVATMVFFANIDPETLRSQTLPWWEIGRRTGYTLGFFMFWAVCAASSYLTLFLFRTPTRGKRH
ncbi:MAG TPA: hypothetical protein VKA32_02930 [Gammaproteobacteria bacterium]|nr:hypothetical protein [Gammaproteobacteria bacterium]